MFTKTLKMWSSVLKDPLLWQLVAVGAALGAGSSLFSQVMETKDDPNHVAVRLRLQALAANEDVAEAVNGLAQLVSITHKLPQVDDLARCFDALVRLEFEAEGEVSASLHTNYQAAVLLSTVHKLTREVRAVPVKIEGLRVDVAAACDQLDQLATDCMHNISQSMNGKVMEQKVV